MAEQEWIPVPRDLDNSPELDALPSGTVLFDGDEDVVIKDPAGVWRYWGSEYRPDEPEAVICLPALVIRKPKPDLIRVRRSKHSMNHRPDGHFNWQVRDIDGQTLVFRTHPLAVAAADRLARTGLIDPIGLVGCFKAADHA